MTYLQQGSACRKGLSQEGRHRQLSQQCNQVRECHTSVRVSSARSLAARYGSVKTSGFHEVCFKPAQPLLRAGQGVQGSNSAFIVAHGTSRGVHSVSSCQQARHDAGANVARSACNEREAF
jgi:hypothetical protein